MRPWSGVTCRGLGWRTGKLLVRVCPAHVYSEDADGTIAVEYVACLECGTCLAVAAPGNVPRPQ
jgi:ferredoxin like protein